MPINDSAGVGVYLIDKSQRASAAIGFRSAGAIESDRGLCNTPTLISSEEDYVKTFGSPSMERHGLAAMEAYLLAQRRVPQVLVRAKNPEMDATATSFGLMTLSREAGASDTDPGTLNLVTTSPATSIRTPVEDSEVGLYFKGEGDYCSQSNKNIVVRFSKPLTQSAYAKEGRPIRMQVFDFEGASHIDNDTVATLAFNPDISSVIDDNGKFRMDKYLIDEASIKASEGNETPVTIITYINGVIGKHPGIDYKAILNNETSTYDRLFYEVTAAVNKAKYKDGTSVIKDTWHKPLVYSDGVYELYSGVENGPQELNCFGLSIAITIEATLPIMGTSITTGSFNYPCGSVTVTKKGEGFVAKFSISTNLYLKNRNEYMFMGSHKDSNQAFVRDNSYWATYYAAYCKEDYTFSLSYDDYDANYVSMQADAVIGSSKYIVSKSSDTFADYTIDYDDPEGITASLQYFGGVIASNKIGGATKSYAYSQALVGLLSDNLTRWRCLATPNLGDVMMAADFISAITAANESTLGLSNVGRAASTDVFNNLNGRHGNRFIADYSQYAYRTLAGKRTAVTMASLVTDLLNSHYNAGIEARPPFGYNYGQISCLDLSQQFSGAERNMLARQLKINPVIEDGGYYLWEERTSQITDTSLSDIHCIISFIWMKFAIYDAMKAFVAEYNDEATVNRGLTLLTQLNQTFISRNYIEEGIVSADKNVIGDEVLRFDYSIRFKGVARFVDVYITAYSQTQTLAISLSQEA